MSLHVTARRARAALAAVVSSSSVLTGCALAEPQQASRSTPKSQGSACEEVPYTVTARKGMASFSVSAGKEIAEKLAADHSLPSLQAKAQFVRFQLLSSGKQASKDVLEQYFCRVKATYPAQLAQILAVESKLDEVLDYTFNADHFSSTESQIKLETWLKNEAAKSLNEGARPFAPERRGDLAKVVGVHNFTKVTEVSVDLKATVAKYDLGTCLSALVASGASTVTSGLSNHLAVLDGTVLSLLTGTADGAQLARRIRDGAKVAYASTPEPDALAGLGNACGKEE